MVVALHNVTKDYTLEGQIIITPVRDVSLEVSPGEFIMIVGRSGSGKSTLLNLLAGLIRPTTGEVLIRGQKLNRLSQKELSRLRSKTVGFIFQFPSLLPALTVLENVALPTMFLPRQARGDAYERAAHLLSLVGLTKRSDVHPKQLSAGEQKRVAIARSLMNDPEILLADEPTSDLDELTEREIMAFIREIHGRGVTVLMVTHSLELTPFATRVLRMEDGQLMPEPQVKARSVAR